MCKASPWCLSGWDLASSGSYPQVPLTSLRGEGGLGATLFLAYRNSLRAAAGRAVPVQEAVSFLKT